MPRYGANRLRGPAEGGTLKLPPIIQQNRNQEEVPL